MTADVTTVLSNGQRFVEPGQKLDKDTRLAHEPHVWADPQWHDDFVQGLAMVKARVDIGLARLFPGVA